MEWQDEGEGKEENMATAQQGRSRRCALVYSSDRPEPKKYTPGCSQAPPREKGRIKTVGSHVIPATSSRQFNCREDPRQFNCREDPRDN